MQKITVVCVGKIKEKYLVDAISEYAKRLGRYCRLDIVEVADEKTPDDAGEALEEQIKRKEGERLLKSIEKVISSRGEMINRDDAFVIALAIEGKQLSSTELAEKLSSLAVGGKSQLVFVIGGSLGLSGEVLSRADFLLSFSRMTFPHQLMRVVLLEQIYRSFRINQGEPYHK